MPIPPKKLKGTDITRAQGHEITRKVSALLNQTEKLPSKTEGINGGIKHNARARATTTGV